MITFLAHCEIHSSPGEEGVGNGVLFSLKSRVASLSSALRVFSPLQLQDGSACPQKGSYPVSFCRVVRKIHESKGGYLASGIWRPHPSHTQHPQPAQLLQGRSIQSLFHIRPWTAAIPTNPPIRVLIKGHSGGGSPEEATWW